MIDHRHPRDCFPIFTRLSTPISVQGLSRMLHGIAWTERQAQASTLTLSAPPSRPGLGASRDSGPTSHAFTSSPIPQLFDSKTQPLLCQPLASIPSKSDLLPPFPSTSLRNPHGKMPLDPFPLLLLPPLISAMLLPDPPTPISSHRSWQLVSQGCGSPLDLPDFDGWVNTVPCNTPAC